MIERSEKTAYAYIKGKDSEQGVRCHTRNTASLSTELI